MALQKTSVIWSILILRVCSIAFFSLMVNPLFAQSKEVNLCEVTVKGIRPERFMVGQKIQDIDSNALSINRFASLSNFLQFNSPVSFKSYGPGQLATISFRGTSANHTALLWNGININFPSLGLTDFSTFPLMAFDQMTIQYGSAASCVGTDAVGGSIQLRSVPQFNTAGLAVNVGLQVESSRNFSQQIGLRFNAILNKNWKFASKTILHNSQNNNEFGPLPRVNKKGELYNIEPTHTSQQGLIQDVFLLHKNGDLASINIWLPKNNLEIQPKVKDQNETTLTKAYRFQTSYQLKSTLFRVAFIRDITDFSRGNNPNPSHTEIDRYIARVEHDFSRIKNCNSGTNVKIGAELVHFTAQVDGYGSSIKTENRADVYMLVRQQFNSRLSGALNFRQAFVNNFEIPFTPSIGVEYVLFKKNKFSLTLPANVSYSYRVPTLNERYWVDLGNPDLLPEKGFNKEATINVRKKDTAQELNFGITAFHNFINNWTYWNPDRNYKVENLQEVLSKGLEIEANMFRKNLLGAYKIDLKYALTNSSQQKEYGPYTKDIIGKQLTYIPRHVWSNTLSLSKAKYSFHIQQAFNSKRYVTFDHSGKAFSPFYLLNLQATYHKQYYKQSIDFILAVNNATNTLYPNLKKNAMPGRSLALTILFNFQNK